MCFYIPTFYAPLILIPAALFLLCAVMSIIISIVALVDAKALKQDLRLRRDAAAAAAASHANLPADIELRVEMARAAVEAELKKPKEDETKPKLKKLEEDLKKKLEENEERLRLLELQGVVQGERLAEVKRRFDLKFD